MTIDESALTLFDILYVLVVFDCCCVCCVAESAALRSRCSPVCVVLLSQLPLGPAADDKIRAADFRAFWGEKV
jgi:hypothetical protein